MIEAFAQKLVELFGPIPIVRETSPLTMPYIWLSTFSGGDPYYGESTSETLLLAVMRPETGALRIEFDFLLHQLSGQCDLWTVKVTGAVESEREALWAIFDPRQMRDHWNPRAR